MDVLIDKAYRSYDYISRYAGFPYYFNQQDQKYIYGTTSQLKEDTPYALYKVEVGDTYDSIALNFYNSPTFYWIICDFNKIQNPYLKPEEGVLLKIPTLSDLSFKE